MDGYCLVFTDIHRFAIGLIGEISQIPGDLSGRFAVGSLGLGDSDWRLVCSGTFAKDECTVMCVSEFLGANQWLGDHSERAAPGSVGISLYIGRWVHTSILLARNRSVAHLAAGGGAAIGFGAGLDPHFEELAHYCVACILAILTRVITRKYLP